MKGTIMIANKPAPRGHGRRVMALSMLCVALLCCGTAAGAETRCGPSVPSPTLQAQQTETVSPIVIGCSYVIASHILRDNRRINIYLPEHYGDAGRKFPVLYLLDGGEREDFLHIAGLAQISAAYGNGQELIVVGIEGVDRRHDLTSASTLAADLKLLPTSGGADAYRNFLSKELKPWVDARYSTNGHSALIGESLAGLFTLETLLDAPSSFDDYIVVSPSLWWRGGAVSRDAEALLRRSDFSGRRVFIAFDDPAPPVDQAAKDRADQDRLAAAFSAANPAGLTWKIARPGEGHATIYHPAALAALRWLYGSLSH
jgi:predicted alpha/beta superfamily hydrolase